MGGDGQLLLMALGAASLLGAAVLLILRGRGMAPRVLGMGVIMLLGGVGVVVLLGDPWAIGRQAPDTDRRPAPVPGTARATAGAMISPSPTRHPVASPAAAVAVQDLVVCDATVDCGQDPAAALFVEVTACFRVTAAGSGQPLRLLVTGREVPPAGPEDPWVLARSAEVRGDERFSCYPVRSVGAPLVGREYWLWVLSGPSVLGQRRFTLAR
jgi:hypothetical protein